MRDKYEAQVTTSIISSTFQRNLADYLTFSRIVISLIILTLATIGAGVYILVILLSFLGALTDIYDGKTARRYLGKDKEGKLGKHDITIDTVFISCIIGYLAFSYIIITPEIGIIWIVLVFMAFFITKADIRVLTVFEIIGVISILIITLIYNPLVFALLIAPGMTFGIIINRRRLSQLFFHKWPDIFSR